MHQGTDSKKIPTVSKTEKRKEKDVLHSVFFFYFFIPSMEEFKSNENPHYLTKCS
jgi:hypothetical protein